MKLSNNTKATIAGASSSLAVLSIVFYLIATMPQDRALQGEFYWKAYISSLLMLSAAIGAIIRKEVKEALDLSFPPVPSNRLEIS